MKMREFKDQYVLPYSKPRYFIDGRRGFIVWRMGTGMNVELLHIRANEQRQGYGRQLFYHMLESLVVEKVMTPYYSVFGFTRVSNHRSKEFYKSMGFSLQSIQGLYYDGEAIMFWQEFPILLQRKEEHENIIPSTT